MARFCFVAPTPILKKLEGLRRLGSSHLLLAHDVAAKPEDYYHFFHPQGNHNTKYPVKERNSDAPSRWIILDNSVIELGDAVNLDMIARAYVAVQPSCVVLPDVMHDCKATIARCSEALDTWRRRLDGEEEVRLMMIPQGNTLQEFIQCAEAFELSGIHCWGVPRNLVAKIGTRRRAIDLLWQILPVPIHMMGFSDDIMDDMLCARWSCASSIDSAVPLRMTSTIQMTSDAGPRGDWWDNPTRTHMPRVLMNISRVKRWINDQY